MSVSVCPDPAELALFRSGSLVFDRHLTIARHLKICVVCKHAVANLPILPEDVPDSDRTFPGIDRLQPDTPLEAENVLDRLGPYRLGREIGRGGMGVVFEGVHDKLHQLAAIKVLSRSRPADPEAHARFRREWAAIGRLDHPNIVRAFHADEENGVPFLAMELIIGCDLVETVRRKGPLSATDAAAIIRFTALGLAHAHSQGVIHRDVKPSNILLTQSGQIKLLDLGLAQLTDAVGRPGGKLSGKTHLGTADYMAPEQWEDPALADARSDIYGLGCVLHFLVSGHAPFSGPLFRTPMQKMQGHRGTPAPNLLEADRQIPPSIAAIFQWMMQKDPQKRPQCAMLVADALEPLASRARLDRLAVAAQSKSSRAFEDGHKTSPIQELSLPGDTSSISQKPRFPRLAITLVLGSILAFLLASFVADWIWPPKSRLPESVPTPVPGKSEIRSTTSHLSLHSAFSCGTRPATALAFSEDSNRVYVGGLDGVVIEWHPEQDVSRPIFTATERGKVAPVRFIVPVPGQKQLVIASSQTLWLVDADSGQAKEPIPLPQTIQSLILLPNSKTVACGHCPSSKLGINKNAPMISASVWDLDTAELLAERFGSPVRRYYVEYAAPFLVQADDHGEILLYDPFLADTTPVRVQEFDPNFRMLNLKLIQSSDEKRFVVLGTIGKSAQTDRAFQAISFTLDPVQKISKRELANSGVVQDASAGPTGDRIYWTNAEGALFQSILSNDHTLYESQTPSGGVGRLTVSPDGQWLITSSKQEPLVQLWKLTP